MGGKTHLGEDSRLDLLGILCTGWEFFEKKDWMSTFSTSAIRTIMAALMRFLPFSYF